VRSSSFDTPDTTWINSGPGPSISVQLDKVELAFRVVAPVQRPGLVAAVAVDDTQCDHDRRASLA